MSHMLDKRNMSLRGIATSLCSSRRHKKSKNNSCLVTIFDIKKDAVVGVFFV